MTPGMTKEERHKVVEYAEPRQQNREEEVKERLDSLQQAMVMDRGKDLCDLLKVKILDSLIGLSERREPNLLLKVELEAIRDGIEELRGKEKEEVIHMKTEREVKDMVLKLKYLRDDKKTDDLLKVVYQRQISVLEWVYQ